MLATTSVPTPALIPSSTSSSTGALLGQRHDHLGEQVLDVQHALVAAVVPGVAGQGRGEAGVVRGPPGPRGGQDGGQAGAQFRVAGPGGDVVDRRVRPRVLVGVPAQQRRAARRCPGTASASQRVSRTAAWNACVLRSSPAR